MSSPPTPRAKLCVISTAALVIFARPSPLANHLKSRMKFFAHPLPGTFIHSLVTSPQAQVRFFIESQMLRSFQNCSVSSQCPHQLRHQPGRRSASGSRSRKLLKTLIHQLDPRGGVRREKPHSATGRRSSNKGGWPGASAAISKFLGVTLLSDSTSGVTLQKGISEQELGHHDLYCPCSTPAVSLLIRLKALAHSLCQITKGFNLGPTTQPQDCYPVL